MRKIPQVEVWLIVTVLYFFFFGEMGVLRHFLMGRGKNVGGVVGWGCWRSKEGKGAEGDIDMEMVDCGLRAGDGG